jgi:hypothetical protein
MKTLMLLSLLFVSPIAQAAGTFACVNNKSDRPARFTLVYDGDAVDFTVRGDEQYCQPLQGAKNSFEIQNHEVTEGPCKSVSMNRGEWLGYAEDKQGNPACRVEGRSARLGAAPDVWPIKITFRTYNAKTKMVQQNGGPSNCGEVPPYKWNPSPTEFSVNMHINSSGNCYFERSMVYLDFYMDSKRVAEIKCGQMMAGATLECKIHSADGDKVDTFAGGDVIYLNEWWWYKP